MTPDIYKTSVSIARDDGEKAAQLELYGSHIAKTNHYKKIKGKDAIYFYLIHKFHWLPRDVRSLSDAEILFILTEEMSDWKVPEEFR